MKLFVSRLREMFTIILFAIVMTIIGILPFLIANLIHKNGAGFLILLLFIVFLANWIARFINWLFIEPFRKVK